VARYLRLRRRERARARLSTLGRDGRIVAKKFVTLVFDRRAEIAGGPGTHALLCGVSAYPHLLGGSGEPTPFSFGLTQLSTPVRTSRAIHAWLVDHADQLAAPLATVRLLLAPDPDEPPATPVIEPPTLDKVLREAAAWRADASAHRDGIALLYLSGHGFIVSRADQVVLLHDYGDGIGSILRNSITVGSIFQGMAPTGRMAAMARTQLFFVDTGQTFQTLPPELGAAAPTQVFDLPPDPGTDRVAITFSPAPGTVAYGRLGGTSIFGAALLDCLDGLGAEQLAGEWAVTALGLVQALPEAVRRQLADFAVSGVTQDVSAGGLIAQAAIVRLPGPPEAELSIEVLNMSPSANVIVRDSMFAPVLEHGPGLDPLLTVSLPAGLYVVELSEGGTVQTLETVSVMPSSTAHIVLNAGE
jgi:hypothetical protein